MNLTTFDRQMSAVAFAEAGEHETAKQILGQTNKKQAAKMPGHAPATKPYFQTILFGLVSLSAYVLLFGNEKLVTEVFTMGGWRWVYPVGAAFFFSFIHGSFAGNLLSCLGLEPKKS